MRRDLHQDRERSRTDNVILSGLVATPCTSPTPHAIKWESLVPLFEVWMLIEIAFDRRIIRKYFWAALPIFVEGQIVLRQERRELGIDICSHLLHVFL